MEQQKFAGSNEIGPEPERSSPMIAERKPDVDYGNF